MSIQREETQAHSDQTLGKGYHPPLQGLPGRLRLVLTDGGVKDVMHTTSTRCADTDPLHGTSSLRLSCYK